jgi:hypothetical protein
VQPSRSVAVNDETESAIKILALHSDSDDSDAEDELNETAEEEISRYLTSKRAAKNIGILAWWQASAVYVVPAMLT